LYLSALDRSLTVKLAKLVLYLYGGGAFDAAGDISSRHPVRAAASVTT
jgi:hypothetical protein